MTKNTILSGFPLPKRNDIINAFVENPKGHAESREFAKKEKSLQMSLELGVIDEEVAQKLPMLPITWIVQQANFERWESLSARLLLDSERIRGVDRENVPRSFKFRNDTVSNVFWHQNVLHYDRKGILQNEHEPLNDWKEKFDLDEFAVKTAQLWKIETWREQEELPLWKQ